MLREVHKRFTALYLHYKGVIAMVPERCLKCEWWNFTRKACDRIVKGKLIIGPDAGELFIETQPGVIPRYMEDEFTEWLAKTIENIVDAWPGWKEIKDLMKDGRPCAGESPSRAIKEFGATLSLAKPLPVVEPEPLKNLDSHGLFRSDISVL